MGLKRHLMELPKLVLIGYGVMGELIDLLNRLGMKGGALIVTGPKIKARLGSLITPHLRRLGSIEWLIVEKAGMGEVDAGREVIERTGSRIGVIIGFGGGKPIDVAKLIAYRLGLPFMSIPTSASHDGIASPFASIKDMGRPYSVMTKPPICVLADIDVIAKAPTRFLRSGCGDLIAKMTAVRDWEIAKEDRGEYFGKYAANLARMSAGIVMEEAKSIGMGERESVRDVVEALISAGVASGIAGSSRPCSGSEHLFSHALDLVAPGRGLHGEKCGMGAIMMAKLQGEDWEGIRDSLELIGAPTRAREIGVREEEVVEALMLAPKIRERYTVLNRARLDRDACYRLAKETGVI